VTGPSVEYWIGLEKANRTNIKKYEKHCLETIYNLGPLDKGEVKRVPGMCVEATCREDRNITFKGCPAIGLVRNSKCRVYKGDLSEKHPLCCSELKCFDNISVVTAEPSNYDGLVEISNEKLKSNETTNNDNKI
jgi:hypothetical protein